MGTEHVSIRFMVRWVILAAAGVPGRHRWLRTLIGWRAADRSRPARTPLPVCSPTRPSLAGRTIPLRNANWTTRPKAGPWTPPRISGWVTGQISQRSGVCWTTQLNRTGQRISRRQPSPRPSRSSPDRPGPADARHGRAAPGGLAGPDHPAGLVPGPGPVPLVRRGQRGSRRGGPGQWRDPAAAAFAATRHDGRQPGTHPAGRHAQPAGGQPDPRCERSYLHASPGRQPLQRRPRPPPCR